MPQRDIQSTIAVWESHDIVLTTTPGDFNGTAVDIGKTQQGVMVAFALSAALDPADDVQYRFQISNDGGTVWIDTPAAGILPTWKQAENNQLENPVAPYLQTAGFIGDGLKWRVVLKVVSLAVGTTVTVTPIGMSDNMQFMGWTTTILPGDGLP